MELFEQTKELLHKVTETIYFFRKQNYYKAFESAKKVIDLLQAYLGNLQAQDAQEFLPVLSMALDAMEEQDGTKLADLYEEGVLPLLYQMQQRLFETSENLLKDCWGKNRRILKEKFPELYRQVLECRENVPDKYQLSWAKTGDLVLDVDTGHGIVRLDSMCDPWQEARLFTESSMGEEGYLVLGFGMGYHIEFLLDQMTFGTVAVLENDLNQLAIALSYRDLSAVLNNWKLSIVYCPNADEYLKYLADVKENVKICIWYPSVRAMEDTSLRQALENYKIESSSAENMAGVLRDNFKYNLQKNDEEVSVLKDTFRGRQVILAAAGPSLDDNLELLKNRDVSKTILVCVGKIAKKLIAAGVKPDYIVMTDGHGKTGWRIYGIEDCGVPLIYLSTVAFNVAHAYRGKRYIAFQKGYPAAEQYAKDHGFGTFETGGSVATFALDMLIRFECSKVICVGLDMGYRGGRTHAQGVGNDLADKRNLRKVEGIETKEIYTSRTLDLYRQWIEKRIQGITETEFINVSKGARIHGMKEEKLERILG